MACRVAVSLGLTETQKRGWPAGHSWFQTVLTSDGMREMVRQGLHETVQPLPGSCGIIEQVAHLQAPGRLQNNPWWARAGHACMWQEGRRRISFLPKKKPKSLPLEEGRLWRGHGSLPRTPTMAVRHGQPIQKPSHAAPRACAFHAARVLFACCVTSSSHHHIPWRGEKRKSRLQPQGEASFPSMPALHLAEKGKRHACAHD